jgi:type IV secretion system protein VirB4
VGDAPADWFPSLTGSAWPGGTNDSAANDIDHRLAAE